MKIAVFDVEDWERESFETLREHHDLELFSEPLSPDNASQFAHVEAISGFVYSSFNQEVLEQLPQLRLSLQ